MLRPSSFVILVARALHTTCRYCATHYDVLEITPKATQSEIKSAYYKLSKIHHPDKSKDEQSSKIFRAITEAYEVLGNTHLKKMYDRGLIVGKENTSRMSDYKPDPEPTDPTLKFYKSRTKRSVTPTMDGERPVYNFDDWSRQHYGTVFKRTKYERENLKYRIQKKKEAQSSQQQETLLYFMLAIGGIFLLFVVNGTSDYDQDRIHHEKRLKDKKEGSS